MSIYQSISALHAFPLPRARPPSRRTRGRRHTCRCPHFHGYTGNRPPQWCQPGPSASTSDKGGTGLTGTVWTSGIRTNKWCNGIEQKTSCWISAANKTCSDMFRLFRLWCSWLTSTEYSISSLLPSSSLPHASKNADFRAGALPQPQ